MLLTKSPKWSSLGNNARGHIRPKTWVMLNHLYCLQLTACWNMQEKPRLHHEHMCTQSIVPLSPAPDRCITRPFPGQTGSGISAKPVGLSSHTSWKDKRAISASPYTDLICQNIFNKNYLAPFNKQPLYLDTKQAQKWNCLHWTYKGFGTAVPRVCTWKSKYSIESQNVQGWKDPSKVT